MREMLGKGHKDTLKEKKTPGNKREKNEHIPSAMVKNSSQGSTRNASELRGWTVSGY